MLWVLFAIFLILWILGLLGVYAIGAWLWLFFAIWVIALFAQLIWRGRRGPTATPPPANPAL